ncbi:hypothetical protein HNQ07_003594 [Deinococcus metalli]|uniref:Uncharacterized protein n=1 Tax=Deinococcus metalli TaxID=1141878 RepID=A0A7W8NSL1_9DEIO|nr:hypothetical protein [Deinococcus metalli]MBB5378093.1 hypothetical protein [Deinococcus metalli]GHF54368.1 hypothetical protein GCM10017781_33350 [Deinococcus metalli]
MPSPTRRPVSVTLRWVPGTMHTVQFTLWGRTFVVSLAKISFLKPHSPAALYLKGSVVVSMNDVTLSVAERVIFDDLERTVGRDNVEPAPVTGTAPHTALA